MYETSAFSIIVVKNRDKRRLSISAELIIFNGLKSDFIFQIKNVFAGLENKKKNMILSGLIHVTGKKN